MRDHNPQHKPSLSQRLSMNAVYYTQLAKWKLLGIWAIVLCFFITLLGLDSGKEDPIRPRQNRPPSPASGTGPRPGRGSNVRRMNFPMGGGG